MTLEIGIDIGSVDYVLLVGLPTGVSGLLQRIGRGNRRTGVTRAGFTVAHDGTRIVAETMFRAARDGRLLGRPYGLRPGVIVQQALVMAAAKGWIDAPTLRAAVPDSMWTEAGLEDAEDLLEHLVEKECLERSNGRRYVVAEEIERRFEAGTLHSNLADEPGVDVVDRLSGEIVGRIDEPDSREIHLGGGTRRVVARQGTRVLTDGATEDVEPRFASRGIPLTSHALATEVVRGFPVSDLAAGQWPTFADQGSLFVFHGLGTLGAYFLRRLVENLRGQSVVVSSSAFGIRLLLPSFEIPSPEEGVLLRLLAEEEHRFTALCAAGPWHDTLPRHVRLHALRRLSGLDSIAKVLASSRLRPVDVAAAVRAAYAKLVG